MSDLHPAYPFGVLPATRGQKPKTRTRPVMRDPAADHLAHIHPVDPGMAASQQHAGQYADYRAANANQAKKAPKLKR